MPFGGLLTAGVGSIFSGLSGLFGGGQQQKTQTNGTITNNQSGNFSQNQQNTSTPNLTPLQQSLIKQFTTGASNLYNQSTNLQPYAASGLEQINQGSNAAQQSMSANLASRGLSFSPAQATAQNQATLSRTGQQASFMNQIPLLQRQLQEQSLGQLQGAFSAIPTGVTQTGASTGNTTQSSTQTQQGTNLISGNPMAGLFSGLGAGTMASLPLLSNAINSYGTSPGAMTGGGSIYNNVPMVNQTDNAAFSQTPASAPTVSDLGGNW